MIRIAHTACTALLVTVALVTYGVKEETRSLERAIETTRERQLRVAREIETLEVEWGYLGSPVALRKIATALYGRDGMIGLEGQPLAPWSAAQVLDLSDPIANPSAAPLMLSSLEAERVAGRDAEEAAIEIGGFATGSLPPPTPIAESFDAGAAAAALEAMR